MVAIFDGVWERESSYCNITGVHMGGCQNYCPFMDPN